MESGWLSRIRCLYFCLSSSSSHSRLLPMKMLHLTNTWFSKTSAEVSRKVLKALESDMATCMHIQNMLGSISHIPDSFPVVLAVGYAGVILEFSCLNHSTWNESTIIYYKKRKGSSQSHKPKSSQMWI